MASGTGNSAATSAPRPLRGFPTAADSSADDRPATTPAAPRPGTPSAETPAPPATAPPRGRTPPPPRAAPPPHAPPDGGRGTPPG
ncbi:hypothetical protein, partial [Nocardia farcinica]|uniref:hypothetical protein n=1 Tax=Nocardia farcinica TaxID=37329 RepID=UPI00245842D4